MADVQKTQQLQAIINTNKTIEFNSFLEKYKPLNTIFNDIDFDQVDETGETILSLITNHKNANFFIRIFNLFVPEKDQKKSDTAITQNDKFNLLLIAVSNKQYANSVKALRKQKLNFNFDAVAAKPQGHVGHMYAAPAALGRLLFGSPLAADSKKSIMSLPPQSAAKPSSIELQTLQWAAVDAAYAHRDEPDSKLSSRQKRVLLVKLAGSVAETRASKVALTVNPNQGITAFGTTEGVQRLPAGAATNAPINPIAASSAFLPQSVIESNTGRDSGFGSVISATDAGLAAAGRSGAISTDGADSSLSKETNILLKSG